MIVHHMKATESIIATLYDTAGNAVKTFSDSVVNDSWLEPDFSNPVVINIPAAEAIDFYFVKNYLYVYGILVSSNNAKTMYQIYDDDDAPQYAATVGKEYVQTCWVGNWTPTFNNTSHTDWYLKITNKSAEIITLNVFIFGRTRRT